MIKTEYEKQPLATRLYLWLRFMPLARIKGAFAVIYWVLHGCHLFPHSTLYQTYATIIQIHKSIACRDMGHLLTLDDALANIREMRSRREL